MTTSDIVQKLWSLCDVLRDDGINYSDYVTELVLLLFIKMEHENLESGVIKAPLLPEYAAVLRRLGYHGGVSVESRVTGKDCWLTGARTALALLRSVFSQKALTPARQ